MLRHIILLILLMAGTVCYAQFSTIDGAGPGAAAKKRYNPFDNNVRVWKIDTRYGTADTLTIDTAIQNHQDNRPDLRFSIANASNGNLGSPLESKIFFSRYYDSQNRPRHHSDNMFAAAYEPYTILPEDMLYYDSRHPFAQFAYRTAFPVNHEEDYVKALISLNANKFINFGGLCNFIYGRGQYQYQSSNMVNGGFWFRFTGKPYELNVSVMFNSYKNRENGGIADNNYILNRSGVSAENIPVNLTSAQSKYRDNCYYFNQRYRVGKYVEDSISPDSTHVYYQPIVVFAHAFRAEDVRRHYIETSIPSGFYRDNFYADNATHDSTAYWTITNTISATLDETFNRKAKFGLSAYVEYEVRHFGVGYRAPTDTATTRKSTLHNLSVGAIWSKNQGKYIRYNVNGRVYLVGERIGNFDVNGDIRGMIPIRLKRDSLGHNGLDISAGASFARTKPFQLYYGYESNHYQWNNPDLENPLTLDIHGRVRLDIAQQQIEVGVGFRNITHYTYLNDQAMPAQAPGNVQVLAIDAGLKLKAWLFHLDAKAVYQISSNRDVLPLPDLALEGNFYFMHCFFKKVFTLQVGVNVRYHTAYYANVYVPALGQFRTQHDLLVGNYPDMNVYITFHVKTIRFFVEYAHFNNGLFGGNNSLSMPGYPINPGTFQMGLSWNFWN